jgi:hypothetical protein
MALQVLDKKAPGRSFAPSLLMALVALLFLASLVLAWRLFEREAPQVALLEDLSHIGGQQDMTVVATDGKSGLRSLEVVLRQGGQEVSLLAREFPRQGLLFQAGPGEVREELRLASREAGLVDGPAELLLAARDFSWWSWLGGNRSEVVLPLLVDTRPPLLRILSSPPHIRAGGSGVVVYTINEPVARHGVMVGDTFHPGHPLPGKGPEAQVAFLGLPYDTESLSGVFLFAVDLAGNEARIPFAMHLQGRRILRDQITVSDGFLAAKLPEFAAHYPDLAGTPLEQYLRINNEIRQANNRRIQEVCASSLPERLWEGRFLRMARSSPRAAFADHRSYLYEGRVVDEQVHLGVDLASVQHAEIEAANRGRVVFADYLGIYGNMVILDHGLGLFSLYSHLSTIDVALGEEVRQGAVLGRSGISGMAGGDHLHFSMLVNGVFVDPIEWWDESWIRLNILGAL